jgi:hypothetical protein
LATGGRREFILSYEIIWEARGVVKRFLGHVTSHDMLQSVVETEMNVRFDDLRYVINDFLGITGISSLPQDVEEISVIDKGASMSNSRIHIAVVATSPEVIALASDYANSPLNVYPTRIFSSLGEARSWLGVACPA